MSGAFNKAKLPHAVIVRAPGLLPMLYRPRELAEDLGISVNTVKGWLKEGSPHERDGRGHIWINGAEFAGWVEETRQSRKSNKSRMKEDEAYCLRCRKPVKLKDPQHVINGKQKLLSSTCPPCGSTINRGSRNGES